MSSSSGPGAQGGSGSCNCGGVRYRVDGPLRPVIACHCTPCRKQSGHYVAASGCADEHLTLEADATLKWYAASDTARRGFCGSCGSALFWKRNGSDRTSIMAGTLDEDGGIKLERHIFCADKGDYYELNDGLPVFAQSDLE